MKNKKETLFLKKLAILFHNLYMIIILTIKKIVKYVKQKRTNIVFSLIYNIIILLN